MMQQMLLRAAITAAVLFAVADNTRGQAPTRPASVANTEKEIRASADAFVAAFAQRDAAAIAAQWTADGVYVTEDGQRFEGREAIQAEYADLFQNCPTELAAEVQVDSVRMLNDVTAIEEGRTALVPQPPGAPRVMSRYTAIHVNQNGRWLLAELHDARVELPPAAGQLKDLQWLTGTWEAASGDINLEVKCRWVENNRFLLRTHAVMESGKAADGGLEVIGIHPATGRITSWSFTNDGGYATGIWTPLSDGGWAVESQGFMEDGTPTSATYLLSRADDHVLTWKSMNRLVGDAPLPDLTEVVLKRKE